MPDPTQLSLYVVASFALLITPGPAVLYIITRSVDQGRQAGMMSVLGIHVGTLFHITAAALGLSAILTSSALAFDVVKYLGAAYLIYVGVRRILSKDEPVVATHSEPASLRRIFSQGVVVNVLNPKTALFFLAFLPQFTDPSRGPLTPQLLTLGAIFVAIGLVTDSSYALLAGTFGHVLRKNQGFSRIQRYLVGTVFIGLGLTAAFTGSKSTSG
ncbi:MAG: LysE family translocator [Anaerolineae bacterium]